MENRVYNYINYAFGRVLAMRRKEFPNYRTSKKIAEKLKMSHDFIRAIEIGRKQLPQELVYTSSEILRLDYKKMLLIINLGLINEEKVLLEILEKEELAFLKLDSNFSEQFVAEGLYRYLVH